ETLVTRYSEIQARGLDPLAELRAMAAAYIEYLCESRELFLIHQSVGYARIRKRLKRKSEIQHHDRVLALSHRAFEQWEHSVGRVYEQGLISTVMDLATTASVMWASINGAFLLTGQDHAFRAITGLSPDHFVEQAFEFHLNAAQALAGHDAIGKHAPANGHKANGVAASGRAKNKSRIQQDDTAAA
ncbi:MAG TPA: hypothetical protein VLL57_05845, partial [Candidatus Binataceae bacterium]|nr:hypothetical protein [Candidatus Binataceae bacterium]